MAQKAKTDFDAAAAETMSSAEIAAFLDVKARKFAKEFNKDLNGTQAAIRAGYKPGKNNTSAAQRAARLLRDPRVRAYRVALIRENVEDMTLTPELLQLKLLEIYNRCMQAEPVMSFEGGEWVETGEWKFDSKGATRAVELLSKMLGYDAPIKVTGADGGPVLVQLSEEALSRGE